MFIESKFWLPLQNHWTLQWKGLFRYFSFWGVLYRVLKMATGLRGQQKWVQKVVSHMLVVYYRISFCLEKNSPPKAQTWFSPKNGGGWALGRGDSELGETHHFPGSSRCIFGGCIQTLPFYGPNLPENQPWLQTPHLKHLAGCKTCQGSTLIQICWVQNEWKNTKKGPEN